MYKVVTGRPIAFKGTVYRFPDEVPLVEEVHIQHYSKWVAFFEDPPPPDPEPDPEPEVDPEPDPDE